MQQQENQLPLLLFVYGTLKRGQPNERFLRDSCDLGVGVEFVGTARTVEKFPLVIATEANIPLLLNSPGDGYEIEGDLLSVRTPGALAALDEFEACPELYRRVDISVRPLLTANAASNNMETASRIVQCQAYMGQPTPGLMRLPRLRHYDTDGEHGMPYRPEADDVDSLDRLP